MAHAGSQAPTLVVASRRPGDADWMECVVDAWARYLADLLQLRCSIFLRKGELVHWIGEDISNNDVNEHCPGCNVLMPTTRRCLLCNACRRAAPIVELGPTLGDVMYRTSNEAYALNETKKNVIRTLSAQQELAFDAIALAQTLVQWSYDAHEEALLVPGTPGNVTFGHTLIDTGGSYDESVQCGFVESPVRVGGFGADLRDEIAVLAEEWLTSIDERVRHWFELEVSSNAAEASAVRQHIAHFAHQIANRVAMLEPPSAARKRAASASVMCVAGLEHLAKVQFVYYEQIADAQCDTDCRGMETLARIARGDVDSSEEWRVMTSPHLRQPLAEVLRSPPPELRQILPEISEWMHFAHLRDIVGNAQEAGRRATRAAVVEWRETINATVLSMLVERATKRINQWERPSSYFVETVSRLPMHTTNETRLQLRIDPRAALPSPPWVRGTSEWQLVGRARLRATRTGLSATGLRIVMLCSALTQMLGTRLDEPEMFARGVVSCSLLHGVASRALCAAKASYLELRELARPLMTGVECAVVKHQLLKWRGSHLEDDLRAAMGHVGHFSLQDLTRVFGVQSEYWNDHGAQLLQKVNSRLVFKLRGEAFVGVVSSALSFALPLVQQYRTEVLGWTPELRGTLASELLRLLPSVRAWVGTGGEDALCVSLSEVRSACAEVRKLFERLELGGRMRRQRVGSKIVWRFEAPTLMELMRPRS